MLPIFEWLEMALSCLALLGPVHLFFAGFIVGGTHPSAVCPYFFLLQVLHWSSRCRIVALVDTGVR